MYNILVSKPRNNFNLLLGGNNMKATTLTMDYVPTGNELNMLFDKAYYRSRASYSTFENEVTTITYDTWDSIVCGNFKKSSLEDIASMVFKAAVDAGADFKAALGTAMFVFRCNGGTRDRAYAWTMKLDWVKEPTTTPATTTPPTTTPATTTPATTTPATTTPPTTTPATTTQQQPQQQQPQQQQPHQQQPHQQQPHQQQPQQQQNWQLHSIMHLCKLHHLQAH